MHTTTTTASDRAAAGGPAAASGAPQQASWRRELGRAFRDPRELCRFLGLDEALAATAAASTAGFPFLVPRCFAARMRQGDADDPLLRQVLPRGSETASVEGYSADPLAEQAFLAVPGLVRKYQGRALLLVTGGCAVNCRYCFRREFPYAESGATRKGVAAAIEAIAADRSISEVILSGGDPLLASDADLADIIDHLDRIPHVVRLRIHTRLPVVLPSRVDAGLLTVLGRSRLARVVVIHANHPAELDGTVAEAVGRLAGTPAAILNQAVLLRGVNDSVAVLRALSERLVEIGCLPYYLHLLDRVRGAAHFEVPENEARALHTALRETLSGYAVPRLVRETPGERSKTWLG